ncbi:MAG: LPS export ABC transporter permease LptG [Deltaproteobacteria bacterium]
MRRLWLPTISRYLLGEFLRALVIALGFFVLLYLCIDFFERLPRFLQHDPPTALMAEYFLLKIPLILTQILPVAVLAATLFGLGTLARNAELMAMRACGISLWQIGAPIAAFCLMLSFATLAWNEYAVPPATTRAHHIENVEIKGRTERTHLKRTGLWYHHATGITNIERVDETGTIITGLTRYELDGDFHLRRIRTIPVARWTDGRWVADDGSEITFFPDGGVATATLTELALSLRESPADFNAVARKADDQSFVELAEKVADLSDKGIDTTRMRVDLWLKLAVPFVSFVMALIGIPLASRHSRNSGTAASAGTALAVGFSYWIVLALTMSLGKSGVLPPILAAWSANAIFASVGLIFFLGSE